MFRDYFEGEEQSVILTEYLEGGELFQRISSKVTAHFRDNESSLDSKFHSSSLSIQDYQLTEAKCRDFFRQIIKGVEYIHSKKILHLVRIRTRTIRNTVYFLVYRLSGKDYRIIEQHVVRQRSC